MLFIRRFNWLKKSLVHLSFAVVAAALVAGVSSSLVPKTSGADLLPVPPVNEIKSEELENSLKQMEEPTETERGVSGDVSADLKSLNKTAIEQYTTEIEEFPCKVDSYIDRAWTYNDMGEYDKALEDLQSALKLQPRNDEAFAKRAWVYYNMGLHRKSLADAKKALSINKKNETATEALISSSATLSIPVPKSIQERQ